jgi:hypothetical protein
MAERRGVGMTKEQLLEVLDDIRTRVEHNDSYEGHIEWLMPEEGDDFKEIQFRVRAGYRIGNTMGQGGFRLIEEEA